MKCSGGGVSRKQRHKLYFSFCAHCWRGSRRNVAEIQEWLLILTSTSVKVMAVAVSRDLSVQVLEDQNTVKLTDRQQYLHDAKQCGQSKCIGVSQVVLGLMIMSYAIPLHFINHTEVVYLGVPWWSGLVFITAGVVAIILDKHCTTRTVRRPQSGTGRLGLDQEYQEEELAFTQVGRSFFDITQSTTSQTMLSGAS
nr:uncharacterized protein LOC125969396 isoform X10 [Syngnathus scovelli]